MVSEKLFSRGSGEWRLFFIHVNSKKTIFSQKKTIYIMYI